MLLFLYLMTISLILIMVNDGNQLMSLLDGSLGENGNWTTSSLGSKLKEYRSTDIQDTPHTTRTEKEDTRRVQALWDPVLNQSLKFSMLEDYGNYKHTRTKVIKQSRLENPLINGNKLKRLEIAKSTACKDSNQTCHKNRTTIEDFNCILPNIDISCYAADRSRAQLKRIKKHQRRSAEYALKVNIFLTRRPLFGKLYPIFVTMPALGNEKFILNLTVDTKDYFIDEIMTKPGSEPNEWQFTKNLANFLRKRGLRAKRLPYTSCYFYRARASFFKSNHKFVIARVSSYLDRKKLLAAEVHWNITVRKPPEAACMPIFSLRSCEDPEYPMAYWSRNHLLFMAVVTGNCGDIRYGQTRWDFYDLREKNLLKHIGITKHFILSLPPYGEYKTGVTLVLRACATINDVLTVARCYLRYTPPKVDARIVGNERRQVDVRENIILDGSQSKDLARPSDDFDSMKFVWSCSSKDDSQNEYCRSRMSDKSVVRLPKNVLREGAQYLFTLTVSSRENPGLNQTARQLLLGISTNTILPDIQCVQNCAYGVYTADESVQLKAECQDCGQPVVWYEWWVGTPEGELEDTLVSQAKFVILNYSYRTLSIRLRVELKNELSGEAFYTLHRNEGPNGSCTVSPSSGIEVVTTFAINCRGFETPFGPLYYRYVIPSTGLIGQSQFARYEAYLTKTDEIGVFICDATDMCVRQTINVDVKPFQFKNPKVQPKTPKQRIRRILRNVKDLIKRGFWNRAVSRSLVAAMQAEYSDHGEIIYNNLTRQEAFSGSQLERLAVLATQLLNSMLPLDHQEVHLLSRIFRQMSQIFMVIVQQRELLHRDAFYSLTAMHMYFMFTLGVPFERHSAVAMCPPYSAVCLNLEKIRLANRNLIFNPQILVEINHWMMATWYLYRCIYFLGVLSSLQDKAYDEILAVRKGGISYQMNRTQVNDPIEALALRTIGDHHVVELSAKLLDELRRKLNANEILFQIITQMNYHNLFWWYPFHLPARTSILIVHPFSRNGYLWPVNESRLINPLVFETDITNFRKNDVSNELSISDSIPHRSVVHHYSLLLDHKAILTVRLLNCSEPIHVKMRLHRRPTSRELFENPCLLTPAMKGRRVWMTNGCKNSKAVVSLFRPGGYDLKFHTPDGNRANRPYGKVLSPLNYTILMEMHQCCHFKNRSIGPGWSSEYCNTSFQQHHGESVHCTCYILGVLATRIFPILAQKYVQITPVLVLKTQLLVYIFLFLLLISLLLVGIMVHRFSTKSMKKLINYMPCETGKLKADPTREIKEKLLIVIVTGGQEFAGTTSNINIYLKSSRRPQNTYLILQDPRCPRLTRNSTNTMLVPRGDINIPTRLALGIMQNGRYPSWYCRTVTIVDLELKRHQIFVVERWIEKGHTQFMRSKYIHMEDRNYFPRYTWWKRFRERFAQLYISWFCGNAMTGPWRVSIGGYAMNRVERTAVLISRIGITISLVSLFYGKTSVESIEEQTILYGSVHVHMKHLLFLSFISFLVICILHLFFEIFVLRWLAKRLI